MSREFQFNDDAEHFTADRDQFRRWRESQRNDDSPAHQPESADAITAVLLYLADGYETGNLAARAAALVILTRPDLLPGRTYRAVAHKLGVSPGSLMTAVRLLRESVPLRGGGFGSPHRSTARFLSIAQIKARRRQLWLEHCERMAEARKLAAAELAREQVRKRHQRREKLIEAGRVSLRDDAIYRKFPRRLFELAAKEMADFDASLGLTKGGE